MNEHSNGVIRHYLPKERDFSSLTSKEVTMIQNRLNHRPRKVLGYKTPYEVFLAKMLKELDEMSVLLHL